MIVIFLTKIAFQEIMVDNIDDISIENSNSMSMIRHKIVFIGDVAVGKTSILNRFLEDKFKDNYEVKNNHKKISRQ